MHSTFETVYATKLWLREYSLPIQPRWMALFPIEKTVTNVESMQFLRLYIEITHSLTPM